MTVSTAVDAALIEGNEKLQRAKESGEVNTVTLYDALDIFSLKKFKDMLTETSLVDLLKHRSPLIIIAPVDEAFERLDPLVAAELNSTKRSERLATLARSHIVPAPRLLGTPSDKVTLTGLIYDLNSDVLRLDGEFHYRAGLANLLYLNQFPNYTLHSINGVRPLSGLASLTRSSIEGFRVPNGSLFLVNDIIIGHQFLDQKYDDLGRQKLGTEIELGKRTIWECFTMLGLTRFCEILEELGMAEFLKQPHDKASQPFVVAPVDEAFRFANRDMKRKHLEVAIKSLIFASEGACTSEMLSRFGPAAWVDDLPPTRYKAANGRFGLSAKCPI